MRVLLKHRNPTIPEALLAYLSVLFLWHLFFSSLFPRLENADLLKYAAAAVSIYLIAKFSFEQDVLGGRLSLANASEMTFLYVAAVLIGVACWALLVFFDAVLSGEIAATRWGIISRHAFDKLEWSVPWLVGSFFLSSFLGPIAEEIIFRGFILARLRERHGTTCSVLISSALFAAVHFNKSFLGAFALGIIYAVLAVRTASLRASILVHGLYNATVFALMACFGVSLVGDATMLSSLKYWVPELLCGMLGLALLAIYFRVWPLGRCGKTVNPEVA